MGDWKEFEKLSVDFLKSNIRNKDISIKHFGNSDSTKSDILVTFNKSGKSFYIETKMPTSQTSQFVVELDDNKFVYGKNNTFKTNEYSEKIIDLLNKNFDYYKNVGKRGIKVSVPPDIALGWIKSNMNNKNVKFVMSKDSKGKIVSIPLENFNDFFDIKTILRRKKSGTNKLSKKYYDDFIKNIKINFKNNIIKIYTKNNRLFVKFDMELSKEDCYIESDLLLEKRYYLSKIDKNTYQVKLTSSTNNPNIFFKLSANAENDFSIDDLINYINEENS